MFQDAHDHCRLLPIERPDVGIALSHIASVCFHAERLQLAMRHFTAAHYILSEVSKKKLVLKDFVKINLNCCI